MSNKNKHLVYTLLISGLSVLISYAINFVITPYITTHIGIEAYGFVSIAKTAVSYAGIITIALTAFIVRYISISYHEGNLKKAQAYYASSVAATAVLSIAILVVALVIIYKMDIFLNIPENLKISVQILFVLVFINFVITTITTPLGVSAYIKDRLDITGTIKIASYICDAGLMMLLFVLFKPDVWFVGAGSLTASLVTMLCSFVMTKKLTPELKVKKAFISINKIKDLVSNGVWNSLNSLGNILNSGLDLVISNLMLTGVETGEIAVAKTIGIMFQTLFQVIVQPLQPQLIKSYAEGNMPNFMRELTRTMKICGYFADVAFAGFAVLGTLYFKLWLPEQNSFLLYMLTVITVLNNVTDGPLRPVYYIHTLSVKNKMPCIVTIIGGFLNVTAMYFLLKYTNLGPFAVVSTTAVIMISTNLFFNPIYAAKCIDISPMPIYRVLLKHLIACVLMCVVFVWIKILLNPSDWVGLILAALTMGGVGLIIYVLVVAEHDEKQEIIGIIKSKINRW